METIKSLFKTEQLSQRTTVLSLFLFSLGIEASFGYCIRIIYPLTLLSIFLLLLHFVRSLYVIVITLLMLFSTLYFPIGMLFGDPSYNVLVSALYTNPEEVVGFLLDIPTVYYIGSFFILLSGIISRRCRLTHHFKNKEIFFLVFFIVISVCYKPLRQFMLDGNFNIIETGFTPVRFLREAYITANSVRKDHEKISEYLKMKDDWQIISATPKYRNYILVIGESERKDLRHNYGFSVKNTPFASAANGIFFENYLSAASHTVPSLTNTLAKQYEDEPRLNNSIIALAKKAGFYTYWISNQGHLGQVNTPVSMIGKGADTSLFIKAMNPAKFTTTHDKELLPFITAALTDNTITKSKLIIVHLIGSHCPFKERTDGYFDVYFHSKKLSYYIQSILNTDRLLENIIKVAQSTGNSWSMLYFSDHGLALENNFFGHSDKYQENYRVPLFILSHDAIKQERITAYRSALHFPILFSQWTGIQEPSLNSNCHYLSNVQCSDQTSIILSNKKRVDISQLPNNPINN